MGEGKLPSAAGLLPLHKAFRKAMEALPAPGPPGEWRVHAPPAKSTRRRIVCPTLSASDGQQGRDRSLPRFSPGRDRSLAGGHPLDDRHSHAPSLPLGVGVRVMYFSHDGLQADSGNMVDLQVSTGTTVEALLRRVREAVGCGERGKLLFKMRPLTDAMATLETCGIHREPKALHLMLSRKHRPPEVADKAKKEAAELSSAMESAAAEAAARGPRQRRNPRPTTGDTVLSAGASASESP
eukprot:gb/GFBE01054901.1/.p1 GENE.gb/GFBE01054901.1/~~gb/GFBE01054901.1/.p1  ORF type:complete len:239 (+),score=24.15 gb/GFBE01054901.1/:1-717(+)